MTELICVEGNIFAKLEMNNPGGSHKYRAAKHIIEKSIITGKIIQGKTTVIEKTGGNFGFGLIAACSRYDVKVDLAVGLSFSQRKRDSLEFYGANLIGKDMLADGLTPKDVVQYHIENQEKLGKQYFYTDQFNNYCGVDAHRQGTGVELVEQLHQKGIFGNLIFIGCAGTGASFAGTTMALRDAGFCVKNILVEPNGCDMFSNIFVDHRMEGASVGVVAPFLDRSMINLLQKVSLPEILNAQRWFFDRTGLFLGNSSAAVVAAIRENISSGFYENVPFVMLAYDNALWYDDVFE